jgi:hypothetical protein
MIIQQNAKSLLNFGYSDQKLLAGVSVESWPYFTTNANPSSRIPPQR